MKKKHISVSVIVPVYNVAPYLARCLDSLVGQTLKDIEIICIDDKSTDNSLEILQEYAKKDSRIKIIAQKHNGGVAAARNAGIDMATGEYLGFVDSDDYVDTDFYEKLYETAKKNNADMARGNLELVDYNSKKIICNQVLKSIQAHGKWHYLYQWWCAIYKKELLQKNNIKFLPGVSYSEDIVFLTQCISKSNTVLSVANVFYHYVRRDGSLDTNILSAKKISDIISNCNIIADIYNNATISDDEYIYCYSNLLQLLYTHINRNTMHKCKLDIANGLIALYNKCKNRTDTISQLGNLWPGEALACLQSSDADGLSLCNKNLHAQFPAMSHTDVLYLLGILPILQKEKNAERITIRLFGIQILKIKPSDTDFRIWILYIPIIRRKRKFKG